MAYRVYDYFLVRRLIVVPIVNGPEGCVPFTPNCCTGSGGSGNQPCGSGCTEGCPTCILASRQWTLPISDEETVTLCYVEEADQGDGNTCRWDSLDLSWSLYYDSESQTWFLIDYTTGNVWFLSGLLFDCSGANDLTSADGLGPATVTPTEVCGAPCQDVTGQVARITNQTGSCNPCLTSDPKTATSGPVGSLQKWSGYACEGNPEFVLSCVGGQYELTVPTGVGAVITLVSFTVSPFQLVFDFTGTFICNSAVGGGRITITTT